MSENKSSGGNLFLTLLGIAFIVLKLCKVINWSWWWVTLPLWGGLVLILIGFLIYLFVAAREDRRRRSNPVKSKWAHKLEEMKAKQAKR
jgi:hypothetical protein